MIVPLRPHPAAPTRPYTRSERVLLTGVPPERRADLVRMLRSPDRVVRDMAVVLVFLDRASNRSER